VGVFDKVLYFRVDGESGARIGGKALKSPQQFAQKKFILLKSVFEDEIKGARQSALCMHRVSFCTHDRWFTVGSLFCLPLLAAAPPHSQPMPRCWLPGCNPPSST
jgi:hypothetical protein